MIENWKVVVGFEGLYEVSDQGRVRSLGRVDSMGRKWLPRIRKTPVANSGYPCVSLHRLDASSSRRTVHRLVLEAFVGPCPLGHEACHNNGDRSDARLSNLRWGTLSENQMDRVVHGTHQRGERAAGARLTADDVRRMREMRAGGATLQSLVARFGVCKQHASDIVNRKRWAHI